MKDHYVDGLAGLEGQSIDAFFAVAAKSLRSRKDGAQYLAVTLSDRTGQIEGRMWDNFAECAGQFEPGDIVKVRAQVSPYNGQPQLNIEKLRRPTAADTPPDPADYLPRSTRDVDAMWAELNAYADGFANPHLKALVRAFLDDPEIASALREAPAATRMHHAWLGGLLEHILSLLGICQRAGAYYPEINQDLLLTGVILHDIGKIRELKWGTVFEYTLPGHLVGHITMGIAMIEQKLAALPDFPPELRMLVEHMVISHHGKYEFGSPKLPMIPEAVMLHYLDDLDAKMQLMRDEFARHSAEGKPPDRMTGWVRSLDRPLLNSAAFFKRDTRQDRE